MKGMLRNIPFVYGMDEGDRMKYRQWIVGVLIIIFALFLYQFNQAEKVELSNTSGRTFEKAKVVEVVKDNLQEDGSRMGQQIVKLKLLTGDKKGDIVEATSFSGYLYGADCTVGLRVIAQVSVYQDIVVASVYNYDRENMLYLIVVLFIGSIWIIGGRRGLNSVMGLIFTFICIIFLYIPMLYKGYSPFWSAVIVVILTTIVSLYLIGGTTYKTLSAILGTIGGVVIAGVFATLFGALTHISGNNVGDIEELVFISSVTDLQVSGLLFSGILISSLGAVMDVSMSIASTIQEIYIQNPILDRKELFKSGMRVGRDMMGTMSNTLILAFTGGSINTLIFIYAYSMQYHQVMNMYDIGIEILQGVTGSLGVILTVPMVSLIAACLIPKEKQESI